MIQLFHVYTFIPTIYSFFIDYFDKFFAYLCPLSLLCFGEII